ncbi:MAG TPA: hypothetical protein P5104_01650 [Bacteroidales bacterium]|nr:hypothetical protein [Bacteroidales bacterium]
MKKLILIFSLAFFADDAINACTFNDDEPKKDEVKKGTSNSKCSSSANCDKIKCADKSDAVVKK